MTSYVKVDGVNVIVKRALSVDRGKGNISCLCYIVCLYGNFTSNDLTNKKLILKIKKTEASEAWPGLRKHLTLPAPCISESYIKIKIYLNIYFRTSLWCPKRFSPFVRDGVGKS